MNGMGISTVNLAMWLVNEFNASDLTNSAICMRGVGVYGMCHRLTKTHTSCSENVPAVVDLCVLDLSMNGIFVSPH